MILAAGQSRRMGAANKLLLPWRGKPVILHVADTVRATPARPVVLVTGHQAGQVAAAVAGHALTIVHNPDFADGIAGSLRAGIAALPDTLDGAFLCLGDLPLVGPAVLDRLVAGFSPATGQTVCVPVHDGRRGHPVLWARRHFAALMKLEGDRGARDLIAAAGSALVEVPMPDAAVLTDVDTPDALAALDRR